MILQIFFTIAVLLGGFFYQGTTTLGYSPTSYYSLTGTTDNVDILELGRKLEHLQKGGYLYFTINDSPGGSVSYGYKVIRLIQSHEYYRDVKVIFKVKGMCASMCTLFIAQDSRINPTFRGTFIYHTIQRCSILSCEPVTSGKYYDEFMHMWEPYLENVLTPAQLKALKAGEDIVVSSEQVNRGFAEWVKQRTMI